MVDLENKIPWSREELFQKGKPRVYRGRELDQIAFPIGGIGTGSIALGGWGQLRDFEIFNKPSKDLGFKYTFFTLHAQKGNDSAVTKVLQGPVGGSDFTWKGSGLDRMNGSGLARFRSAEFEGAFPFGKVKLEDPGMPLEVSLEGFNPFIPLNADDSGLPVAMFVATLRNPGTESVKATLFANLENKLGYPAAGGGRIEAYAEGGLRGLKMSNARHGPESSTHGTLALVTPHRDVSVQTHWVRAGWFDSLHRFWDAASEGRLEENDAPAENEKDNDVGSIALHTHVAPGETVRLPVWIVWHLPNALKYWENREKGDATPRPGWKNYYATKFEDASAVAAYVGKHHERLENQTRKFADALFSSTLPEAVMDAVSSQISILKTTTCIRLEDGTFWAWEGCAPDRGCCPGTCTHVWNYAQALPFLFPELERSIREAEYRGSLREDGGMTFRMPVPLGLSPGPRFTSAADGQMGGVMKVYREWQISGDDEWLKKLWPSVKKSLAYAWKWWDKDRDGVMEGVQHNTYDIEFHGPNTMMGSFYLGALRAAEEMGRHLNDEETVATCRSLYASGREKMDAELFNGEYYIQDIRLESKEQNAETSLKINNGVAFDPSNPKALKYQYGKGCLSDQVIGQWLARITDLGDLFDSKNVRAALQSIFRHNWKTNFLEHANPQRIYALNDESGLLLCSWPKGERPELPFVYSDEVWCGIEYQVASHMVYEGLIEEGLAVVKGVRERHTGVRRNPWNEFECGNHYARSMASYALLPALSGFFYSAPKQALRLAPRIYKDDFACFYATGSGWGRVTQRIQDGSPHLGVEVHAGFVDLKELQLGLEIPHPVLTLKGTECACDAEGSEDGTVIRLRNAVRVEEAQCLMVKSNG